MNIGCGLLRSFRLLAMTIFLDCFVVALPLPRNDGASGICIFCVGY
ncbi:hypothetical protein [Helicobacter sp. MIT 01-3238]|nr:hypothetical protein [Helicobacter sp. MIT 01-3238]